MTNLECNGGMSRELKREAFHVLHCIRSNNYNRNKQVWSTSIPNGIKGQGTATIDEQLNGISLQWIWEHICMSNKE